MPIVKKNEPIGERPVIILIYGEPGIGKTSLFNTADKPLLIDFDRGVDRSILRQDTLVVKSWQDVLTEEKAGTFTGYKTIGIDTAKAALDDFLMTYVTQQDYKLAKNKLQAYGAIGDGFKLFVNNRRQEDGDIVIIAHAKDDKEGDVVRKFPDVTGGSYQLLLRIADQVGYMRTVNNKRTIQFEPTDTTVGKNVARLPMIEVPNEADPAFRTFMAELITKVKEALSKQSESQLEAVRKSEELQERIADCTDPDSLTKCLEEANTYPEFLKVTAKKLIGSRAHELGFIANKETRRFENPNPVKEEETTDQNEGETAPFTDFDERCKQLADAGMIQEADQMVSPNGAIIITYGELADLEEVKFQNFLGNVKNSAKAKQKRKSQAA